ncbi:MAG: putative peptidoglycan glycosyltransferase FtsW [Patescibacteria group bacterium]
MFPRQRRSVAVDRSGAIRRHRPDYVLVIISVILMVIGLVVIYAISPGLAVIKNVGENYYATKQVIAILLAIICFLIAAQMPINKWKQLEKSLIILSILSVIAVQLLGEEVNGAYRWVQIGGLSFQAVELIKLTLIIWLAGLFTNRIQGGEMADFNKTLKPILIVLGLLAVVVAILQSDLGSMGVLVAIVAMMSFIAGLPLRRVMTIGTLVGVGAVLAISSTPYRRERLANFLQPERDCQNSGYQACQALITVGSGGVFGKGLGHGVQAYGYLPEAANDSIFAIMAEKFGFFGLSIILCLYVILFSRMRRIIERTPDMFSRFMVSGILAWLSTQSLINIGAMTGLLPLKGITLPFVSAGGTSLLFIALAIGIVFQVSRYTSYGVASLNDREGGRREDTSDWRRNRRPYNSAVSRRP